MVIGFLLEAFGPRSLPWTILVCAGAQAAFYIAVHVLAAQGAAQDEEGEPEDNPVVRKVGSDAYSKVALGADDSTVESGVEMTEL